MSGRLMAVQKFNAGQQQVRFMLPAGKLSKGIYILEALINGKKYTGRVLKE
ncbi:MAG: T9SS type A sorting domain-containing protein [Chitinophagaceae bacterium]|nr:T9SS type A sorting domain-containing protein [Chitinophagaceae bacterium]